MDNDLDQLSAPTTALPPGFAIPPGMPTPTAADFKAASTGHGAGLAQQPQQPPASTSWLPWAVGGGAVVVALFLVYHATNSNG